ncbi:MAG: hypothetical protein PHD29_06555 [bacterium]|nr:hypothetical protein [bacterium]MDD5353800.1 hypothetical protein [bacterium]MDD5756172.1 hypothetical protein [bacterium]
MKNYFRDLVLVIFELLLLLPFALLSVLARGLRKSIAVGIGPEPLINNIHHKKALAAHGYAAQTFVNEVYYITAEFDVRADLIFRGHVAFLRNYYLFALAVLRYKCLYLSFNGGPLAFTCLLWRVEPLFYRLAGVKTVLLPYGGDVQDMSRSPNLLFKNAMCRDYPKHRFRRERIAAKIDLWTKYASHITGGCEWVDYLYHWDTLMLAHFSIDTDLWQPARNAQSQDAGDGKIRVLHAPNHRTIKGTQHFIQAIDELNKEGFNIELVVMEQVSNEEIRKTMASVDIVADQLIVGWYAMFALEAMALEKPVLCYIRKDLEDLYIGSGLLRRGELPIIKCSPGTVKNALKDLILNKTMLPEIGSRSREYVVKHHALGPIGEVFKAINGTLGLKP